MKRNDADAQPEDNDMSTATTNGSTPAAPAPAPVPADTDRPHIPDVPRADMTPEQKEARQQYLTYLMRTREQRASAIKAAHNYDGTLTTPILDALRPILREETPRQYVKETPPTEGKPYTSTGVSSLQYFYDFLSDVFGLSHWVTPMWYSSDGTSGHGWVLIGNNLAGIEVDEETGRLIIPDDAEILVRHDGWGGYARGRSVGDCKKGTQTNTLKRVIAMAGPAADVTRLDVDAELVDGSGPAPSRGGRGGGGGGGGRPVPSDAQVKMLWAKANSRGLPHSQLANLFRAVLALDVKAYDSEEQAKAVLEDKMPKMPRQSVQALVEAIESATPTPMLVTPTSDVTPARAAPAPAQAPAATPTAQGNESVIDRDSALDLYNRGKAIDETFVTLANQVGYTLGEADAGQWESPEQARQWAIERLQQLTVDQATDLAARLEQAAQAIAPAQPAPPADAPAPVPDAIKDAISGVQNATNAGESGGFDPGDAHSL